MACHLFVAISCWVTLATPKVAHALFKPSASEPQTLFVPPASARPGLITDDRTLDLPAPEGAAVVNGSIGRLGDTIAIVYRLDSATPSGQQRGQLAMVELDRALHPIGQPSILETRLDRQVTPTAEDPRLVEHDGRWFVVYNSTDNGEVRKTRRDMYLLEVGIYRGAKQKQFYAIRRKRMLMADGQRMFIEKNWTPFSHEGRLHFIYNTNPPYVGALDAKEWASDSYEVTLKPAGKDDRHIADPLGTMRGGTPALLLPDEHAYLSFHHTFMLIGRLQKRGQYTALYLAGAYLFDDTPPFAIRALSYVPIVPPSANEDADLLTDHGRKLGFITYPTGVIYEAEYDRYHVSYSQNDIRVRVMTIDGRALKRLMLPAANKEDVTR